MFYFNPAYMIYMLPAFILMMAVQWYVNSAYQRWSRVATRSRMSGREAAQRLILRSGLHDVQIEGIAGRMSDHYDPRTRVLRLSDGVYNGGSVASLAIAAHELGHAEQDHEGYFPLRLRSALVPAVNIGSYLGWIFIFLGLFLRFTELAWLGVLIFAGGALFALATIPVELNASARAKRLLVESGLIQGEEEMRGVNHVLNAAALTYVAALVTAVMQLLYYASLVAGMGGRRRS
ncbi:MAG: zinc metallopeptidase [Chloroflexi bacterium]|nr:zinc metallopeptidase [Chloroflexota bacterium]